MNEPILPPYLISHSCVVSSLGAGREATLSALRHGQSGLRPCHFETVTIPTYIGDVEGVDDVAMPQGLEAFDCRNNRLALMALSQDGFLDAVAAAKQRYGAHRIGVFAGTSTAGILETELTFRRRDAAGALPAGFHYRQTQNTFSVAEFAQKFLDLTGPSHVVSAACASTAKSFADAARMILLGVCDAAVVGGADSLCLTTLYGFQSLQLVSADPCRPYDAHRNGISIGEAAGFALLERVSDVPAPAPGAVRLVGFGESSDAYHMSSPHPEGVGAALAMRKALHAAGLEASAIDYVNLHGTATLVGDAAEDRGIVEIFGKSGTPCNSTKGYTGHTLGASGILETVISALCIEHGFMPSSPTTTELDQAIQCHYVVDGGAQDIRRVMSNSFGFGGSNCSLILERAA